MQTTSLLLRKRIATLSLLFTIAFSLLGVRLFWVQFVKGAELSAKAEQNRMRDIPVEAKRGIIYDRNGRELAISVSANSVGAYPAEVKASDKAKETAHQLAQILGKDENEIYTKITQDTSFVWVQRQIEDDKAKAIRNLNLKGIGLTEENRREYPKGTLASHILGIAGIDNTGLEGVDFYYNDLVGGTKGRIIVEKDGKNQEIPEATHKYIAPIEGSSLVLSIDETIQFITERELEKVFQERKAKRAAAIVMDPATGEILAMASRPTFDPNNFNEYPASNRRNFAINDAYEPGSTMKITTACAAMEEHTVNSNSRFYCPGYVKVGKESISCANGKVHGSQTFAEIVENSCNVGFVQVGLDLGIDRYYKYLTGLGFGELTGIDLPGEAKGILVPKSRAKQIDLATMAMGQANAVTPIQLITAVSAVANDGVLMKPHLLREVVDINGKTTQAIAPQAVRRVISSETARELCAILEGEVTNGTGLNAYIDGYKTAGKTGTAQKIAPGGGYMANEYVASFVGFAPADNPRLVCLVVVDAPQGYPYFGGWVAAPVFREIMRDSLRYLREPLNKTVPEAQSLEQAEKMVVPDVINLPLNEAVALISSRGLNVKLSGSGSLVWQQTPRAGTKVSKGSQVMIYMSPGSSSQKTSGDVTIPDLQGKSMKEVAKILSDLGLHLIPEGTGLAYEQAPLPGKVVAAGSNITVKFQAVGE